MFMLNQDLTELEQNSVEQELNIPPPQDFQLFSHLFLSPYIQVSSGTENERVP